MGWRAARSFSHTLFDYMLQKSDMEDMFPTDDKPNWYTILYLNNNQANNIIFDPYDVFKESEKIGYIIYLSWWSEINWKFIYNPLSKTDEERVKTWKDWVE